jgi:hypothetical protein
MNWHSKALSHAFAVGSLCAHAVDPNKPRIATTIHTFFI